MLLRYYIRPVHIKGEVSINFFRGFHSTGSSLLIFIPIFGCNGL